MMPRGRRMIGRDGELARLHTAAVEARAGSMRLVVVTGEAGIGKSRLITEFVDQLDDALLLESHGVDLSTGDIPFGGFADLLRNLEVAGDLVLTEAERQALAPLLPGAVGEMSTDRVTLLNAGVRLLERLSSDRLVCWVLEDLHWVDAATRDLLALVARAVSPRRLLVLASVRTDDADRPVEDESAVRAYVASLTRLPVTTSIALSRLSRTEVDQQLAGLVHHALPAGAADRIAELSDGVPFLVEELAAVDGRPELSTAAAVTAARVESVPAQARRLVEAAAVGAGHLRLMLLEEVADLSAAQFDEALRAAIRAGILVEAPDRDGLAFRHALLRDAVDRSIPPGARRDWHRRWAEVLEHNTGVLAGDPARLAIAEHWFQSGVRDRALAAALVAAPSAYRIGAGAEESRLWRRALELWPEGEPTFAGHTWRDCLAGWLWFLEPDADFLRQLLESTDDPGPIAILQLRLHAAFAAKDQYVPIDPEQLDRWTASLRDGPEDLLRATGLFLFAGACQAGDPRSVQLVDEAAELYDRFGDARGRIGVCACRAWLLAARGRPDAAAELLDSELRRPDLVPSYELWWLDGSLICCLAIAGRHGEVEVAYERARARVEDPRAAANLWEHVVENVTFSWTETGQWQRAVDLICQNRPYWAERVKFSDLRQARIQLRRTGALPDAEAWTRSLVQPDVPGGPSLRYRAHLVAEHAGMTGDRALLRRAAKTIWDSIGLVENSDELWAAVRDLTRCEVDLATDDPDPVDRPAAEDHLARIADAAARLRRLGPLGDVWPLELEAQLARFRDEDCHHLFEVALAGWERVGHVYDAAVCHLYLAEVLATEGARTAARSHVLETLAVARRLEAGPLVDRAERLLSRLGGSGEAAAGLTAREREVLELVAAGRTNGQIAASLFISPKTASVHVSRIIAKLAAANRTEAAAIARARGLV